MNHPHQKTYALISALTGLAAILLALAAPACTNGKHTAETSNLTGQQRETQRQCDDVRKSLKQEFVIHHRLKEMKTELEAIAINISKEERSELGQQTSIAVSALEKEESRTVALKKIHDIHSNVATRVQKDLEHPSGQQEGTKLKYENSTFTMKNKNILGLALRQAYDKPSEHEKIQSVTLVSPTNEVRALIFVEVDEKHDIPLSTYINGLLPVGCETVPSKLNEYYFNTLIDGLKL